MSNGPRPVNIIIDIVLAEMIFRQPAVNLRSPQRHLTQLQRGRA
ncbi:ArsR family transcriptional regulator [Klebsiella pneumoniae]|uniref:ArsR family transcriptional regulator n=1 Tax=Klebsiella pneumoniae TaxID=573 RepID=A0A939NSI7_KLEPN|nr:ArsR family transcriptional regulator [Klebsiella pneumoniae]